MKLVCLLAATFVGLHVWFSRGLAGPSISDEVAYLAIARFLALGPRLPDMDIPYAPGYSLLLVPAFRLISDPSSCYQAVLVINALLLGTVPVTVYLLATQLWPDLQASRRLLIAVVIGCYPPYLLDSNLAMAENALIPVFLLACLLAGHAFAGRNFRLWFGFGVASACLYTIHARTLPVLAAAVLTAGRALWPWNSNVRPLSGFLSGLAAGLGAGILLSRYVFRQMLLGQAGQKMVIPYSAATANQVIDGYYGNRVLIPYSPAYLLAQYADPRQVLSLVYTLGGQAFYLCVATLGLFAIGLAVALICLKQVFIDGQSAPQLRFGAFVGLAMLGTWLLSSLFMTVNWIRSDIWIYGRYNEGVLAPVLLLGMIGLVHPYWRARLGWQAWAVVFATGLLASSALLFLGRPAAWLAGVYGWTNIMAFYPVLSRLPLIGLPILMLGGAVFGLALIYCLYRQQMAVAAIPIAIFLLTAADVKDGLLLPRASIRSEHFVAATIERLVRRYGPGIVPCVAYDQAAWSFWDFHNDQFYLPEIPFRTFDSTRAAPACPHLFISSRHNKQAATWQARLLAIENNRDQALWVLPGSLEGRLERDGQVLPLPGKVSWRKR